MDQVWANRAASAEAAVAQRHLKRSGDCRERSWAWWPGPPRGRTGGSAPGTTGGRRTCWTAWSTRRCATRSRSGASGSPGRSAAHRLRNNVSWTNSYYDDMAWLALALERAARLAGVERSARAGQARRPVRQRVGARGRRRHPVAQAGPVLQRPGQRSGGHLPGPLRRPAAAGPADGRLDRRDADRPRDAPGVRRHQGRLAGARAVHLLPGRGARAGNRTRRPHRGRPARRRGCSAWSRRSASSMAPDGVLKGAGGGDGGLFAGHHRALPRAGRHRPARATRRDAARPRTPRARSCWPRRSRRGTTGRPSTACRCSGRSGTATRRCPRRPARRRSSSRAR